MSFELAELERNRDLGGRPSPWLMFHATKSSEMENVGFGLALEVDVGIWGVEMAHSMALSGQEKISSW